MRLETGRREWDCESILRLYKLNMYNTTYLFDSEDEDISFCKLALMP